MSLPLIVVSVVSHRQDDLVRDLLTDIDSQCRENIRIVLTLNVPEFLAFEPKVYRHPIDVIRNERARPNWRDGLTAGGRSLRQLLLYWRLLVSPRGAVTD